jgi:hypothetical protein
MDGFQTELPGRLPLTQAVLRGFAYTLDPATLAALRLIAFGSKKLKNAAKRLKALRGVPGKAPRGHGGHSSTWRVQQAAKANTQHARRS